MSDTLVTALLSVGVAAALATAVSDLIMLGAAGSARRYDAIAAMQAAGPGRTSLGLWLGAVAFPLCIAGAVGLAARLAAAPAVLSGVATALLIYTIAVSAVFHALLGGLGLPPAGAGGDASPLLRPLALLRRISFASLLLCSGVLIWIAAVTPPLRLLALVNPLVLAVGLGLLARILPGRAGRQLHVSYGSLSFAILFGAALVAL
ncbi:hypothetical protein [Phenylobacterium sp.]|uniref:hypothetical protein n=1 Tax=Phenylobacterium sp. TaxID=1871053 RepID=UPI00301C7342